MLDLVLGPNLGISFIFFPLMVILEFSFFDKRQVYNSNVSNSMKVDIVQKNKIDNLKFII